MYIDIYIYIYIYVCVCVRVLIYIPLRKLANLSTALRRCKYIYLNVLFYFLVTTSH